MSYGTTFFPTLESVRTRARTSLPGAGDHEASSGPLPFVQRSSSPASCVIEIPGRTELDLLRGVSGTVGERKAIWEQLARQEVPQLERRLRRRAGDDRALVADVIGETFVRARKYISSYRGVDPVGAWLGAIADRVLVKELRRSVRRRSLEAHWANVATGGAADTPESAWLERIAARQNLEVLTPGLSYRDIEFLRLRFRDGMSHYEIADQLGYSSPKVSETRQARILKRLRERFQRVFPKLDPFE